MRRLVLVCPDCCEEARLGIELDVRVADCFPEGMHAYCSGCSRYQQMTPEETATKAAA